MHDTYQLFSAEEAFVRLGQSREKGCLVVVNSENTVRLFLEEGCVVQARAENSKGESALQEALKMDHSSYVWIPQAESKNKSMKLNIIAHAMKHSIARDTKNHRTKKVSLGDKDLFPKKTPSTAISHYYLVAEDYTKEDLRLKKQANIVGRDPASCDIVLQSIQVSRRHCLLEIQKAGIYIKDLGSTNGIKINGIPAKEGLINCGDLIAFGTFTWMLGKE